jgi:gliding motility-associated-like protein
MRLTRLNLAFFTSLCFLIFSIESNAQYWLRSGGSPQQDGANDVAVDAQNATYTVGSFRATLSWGSGIPQLNSSGLSDGFLVKFDSDGGFEWQQKFGGTQMDVANGVAVDGDGNIFVVGTYSGTLNADALSVSAEGSADSFIAKLDENGNVLWLKSIGQTGVTALTKIAIDSNSDAVVVGTLDGSALFGDIAVTSDNNSADVFVAKISSEGAWQWVNLGEANQDDQAADVAIDGQNNIYITGNFSNAITFDIEHANTILNAGMVVKFNANGVEQGFHSVMAVQITMRGVAVDEQGRCYVTGSSQGIIDVVGLNEEEVGVDNAYSFFVLAFSSAFSHSWTYEDGSDQEVIGQSIAIGPDGNVFVGGSFKCEFTEYSGTEGVFISSGYEDVFVTAITPNQVRLWSRQYGGPREDVLNGIAVDSDSRIVFCGEYEKFFHVPSSANFLPLPYWFPLASDPEFYPNEGNNICPGCSEYGEFKTVKAAGARDLYLAKAVDLSACPFDIFHRDICGQDAISACIIPSDTVECIQTIVACGQASFSAYGQTGADEFLGPAYNYLWSTGAATKEIGVSTSGTYSAVITRADGCQDSQTAEIEVTILPLPEVSITVQGEFIYSDSLEQYQFCDGNCIDVIASPSGGEWSTNVLTPNSSFIDVCETGLYSYTVEGANGCESSEDVTIISVTQPSQITPDLLFLDAALNSNPQIEICANEAVLLSWVDLQGQISFSSYGGASWTVLFNGSPFQYFEDSGVSFPLDPGSSGTYTITSVPYIFNSPPCSAIDTVYYTPQTLQLQVTVLPTPDLNIAIDGPSFICPGESVELVATGGETYQWSPNPGIVSAANSPIIVVDEPGTYIVSSTETFANGCSDTDAAILTIDEPSSPVIVSSPSHNYVCPGQNVVLTVQTPGQYSWYFNDTPLGIVSDSLVVTTPGFYSCVQGLGACQYESNPVEISNYTTPYMVNTPNDLCLTGEVEMCVSTYDDAIFSWQSPLAGDDRCIMVSDTGTFSVSVTACDITTDVYGTVMLTEIVPEVTPSPEVLCTGYSVTLSGPPGFTGYAWTSGLDSLQHVLVDSGGTYVLTVTDSNGCHFASAPFFVEEITNLAPDIPGNQICRGEEFLRIVNGDPLTWWTMPDVIGDTVYSNTIDIPGIEESLVVYFYDVDEICRSPLDSVEVLLYPSSNVQIIQNDTAFCAGGSYQLTATCGSNAGIQFQWLLPDGTNGNTPTLSWLNSNSAPSGWYVIQTSDEYCDNGLDSILVTIEYPHSTWIFEQDSAGVCIGSDILLMPDSLLSDAIWQTPQGVSTEESIFLENADFDVAGNYIITAPGSLCTTITDTIPLEVVEYPIVLLNDSTVYCTSGYLMAHLTPGYDFYTWSNGDTDENAIVPFNGYLSVVVTNWPGCSDAADYQAVSVPCIDEFPNVFSPNGDGLNEYLDFGLLRIPIEMVSIFNRWGALVKELNPNSSLRWNGNNESNEPVSSGVYYWIISPTAPLQTNTKMEGYIHVFRNN